MPAFAEMENVHSQPIPEKLIDLKSLLPPLIGKSVGLPLEWILGIQWINRKYKILDRQGHNFFDDVLKSMNIHYHMEERSSLQKEGGVLVVANHPFGAIEGMMLGDWLMKQRDDVRILANGMLGWIPEVKEMVIQVNPFDGHQRENAKAMLEALKWLKNGGVLLTFPAGEVSSFSVEDRKVSDPIWSAHMARLARKSKANILPIHVEGRNSLWFQSLGLLHPRLRTLRLGQELINKMGKTFRLRSGQCWGESIYERFPKDDALISFLRDQTYALCPARKKSAARRLPRKEVPIIDPIPLELLQKDLWTLPNEQVMLRRQHISVYAAESWQIPNMIREIGRLREVTFRPLAEGTGQALDLDEYDSHYIHLFAWDEKESCLVGAYRIGHTDEILNEQGSKGLYSHSLFRLSDRQLENLRGGLELGRSFVVSSYQKSRYGLPLLWQGIGQYLFLHPQYHSFYGCVSICSQYQRESIDLMVDYCRWFTQKHEAEFESAPTKPYRRSTKEKDWLKSLQGTDVSPEELSDWVSGLEPDGKGIPVLLRHYLRLGAEIVSFNVDHSFGDVVDGLVILNLQRADVSILARFMGKESLEHYLLSLKKKVSA